MFGDKHRNILFGLLTQREFRIWRHLFFIIAVFPIGLSQAFFVLDGNPEISTNTIYGFGIFLALTIIGFVYFNIYFLALRFLPIGQYASYLIALLGSVLGFIFMKYTAEYWIYTEAGITREYNGVTVLDGLSNLMLYSICIASGSITLLFKRWMEGNEMIENLEVKQLRNSIEDIKNSVHPAFLYATLNYASEKVKSEPEHTSDTLFRLSELLRYQLYDSKRDKVLLDSDIQFIRNYLVLERQNSEDKFSYTVSVNGDANKMIPTALFMPWIEGITQQYPSELHVAFDINACLIKFKCRVVGMNLSLCDFPKIEQKLIALYSDDITIDKGLDWLDLQLKIC